MPMQLSSEEGIPGKHRCLCSFPQRKGFQESIDANAAFLRGRASRNSSKSLFMTVVTIVSYFLIFLASPIGIEYFKPIEQSIGHAQVNPPPPPPEFA